MKIVYQIIGAIATFFGLIMLMFLLLNWYTVLLITSTS